VTTLRARSGPRTLLAAVASLGLVAALAMPALAGEDADWATVTGYADGSASNNQADTWGDNCTKIDPGGDTYVLPELEDGLVYSLVVVKAGADQSTDEGPNTLFAYPSAGQTVWADSAADGEYGDGDKEISHIILCTEEESEEPSEEESPSEEATPSEEESPSEEATPSEGELGGTPTQTPGGGTVPDTAIGTSSQVPAMALSLVLLASLASLAYLRLARQR
jgi:hypothetical protein